MNPNHRDKKLLFGLECEDCGNLTAFADDSVYIHASKLRILNQEKIDNSFLQIRDFLNSNGMQINEGKTFLTEFMTKQKRGRLNGTPPTLTVTVRVEDEHDKDRCNLEDRIIQDSTISRTLGLNLQNNLSWEAHLSRGKKAVLPRARSQLGRLFKLQDSLSRKTKLLLVNSLVISKLAYGICLWGHGTENHLRQAQILMNQAGRFITGMDRTSRSSDIMTQCHWLNVREMTRYYTLIQFFKTVKWGAPEALRRRIEIEDDLLISTERPRLLLTQGAFRVQAVALWNNLPDSIRTEGSLSRFKVLLRRWIIERRDDDDDDDDDPDPDLDDRHLDS